jgi:hypothetical protein
MDPSSVRLAGLARWNQPRGSGHPGRDVAGGHPRATCSVAAHEGEPTGRPDLIGRVQRRRLRSLGLGALVAVVDTREVVVRRARRWSAIVSTAVPILPSGGWQRPSRTRVVRPGSPRWRPSSPSKEGSRRSVSAAAPSAPTGSQDRLRHRTAPDPQGLPTLSRTARRSGMERHEPSVGRAVAAGGDVRSVRARPWRARPGGSRRCWHR